jgi:hypothetical protein
MDGSSLGKWLCLIVYMLTLLRTEGASIPMTIVQAAVARGAGEQLLLISWFNLC